MDTALPEYVILKKKRKIIISILATVLIFLTGIWLVRFSFKSSINKSAFTTAVVEKGNIENTINASGEVLPEFEETITSPISASIQKVIKDAGSMEQALINIIKNAVEAIDEEGAITIITQTNPKHLIIRDSGKGISPGFEEYLFSPFYSTKKDGQGVGLTVIREILSNHSFDFSLKTIAPGITEFRINFE